MKIYLICMGLELIRCLIRVWRKPEICSHRDWRATVLAFAIAMVLWPVVWTMLLTSLAMLLASFVIGCIKGITERN